MDACWIIITGLNIYAHTNVLFGKLFTVERVKEVDFSTPSIVGLVYKGSDEISVNGKSGFTWWVAGWELFA